MNLNSALDFFISNITHFIGAFFVVVLFLFAVSIYLGLKEEKAHEADKSDLKGLEETLRKVIETAPSAAAQGNGSDEQVGKLKSELQLREKELQELRNSFETAKEAMENNGANNPVMDNELQKKVEDLEARLAEYEIIEDDIANLSIYKEENAKLKKQIESLKTGGDAVPEAGVPPEGGNPSGPQPETEASEDIMAEFAEAVAGDTDGEESEAPEEKPKEQAEAEDVAPAATAEQEISSSEVEVSAPTEEVTQTEESDETPFGELDTDKLAAEASNLKEVHDSDDNVEEDDDDNGDVGQKLISEFEEFVKKEGGA